MRVFFRHRNTALILYLSAEVNLVRLTARNGKRKRGSEKLVVPLLLLLLLDVSNDYGIQGKFVSHVLPSSASKTTQKHTRNMLTYMFRQI